MDHIGTIFAIFLIAFLAGQMISMEISDRRDHRRWKANLRRIQSSTSFRDEHGNDATARY